MAVYPTTGTGGTEEGLISHLSTHWNALANNTNRFVFGMWNGKYYYWAVMFRFSAISGGIFIFPLTTAPAWKAHYSNGWGDPVGLSTITQTGNGTIPILAVNSPSSVDITLDFPFYSAIDYGVSISQRGGGLDGMFGVDRLNGSTFRVYGKRTIAAVNLEFNWIVTPAYGK